MKNKIGIIGAGSFGTALAILLTNKGHDVSLWGRKKSLMSLMEEIRENPHYLPGVRLPETIRIAYSMEEALEGAEIALFAVPAQSCIFCRFSLHKYRYDSGKCSQGHRKNKPYEAF